MLKASLWMVAGGRLERGDERARDVLDVGERAPRRAVGLHPDLAGRVGVGDEVVDHDVAAHAGRDAVGGRVAEEDGGEGGRGERGDVALREHLRLAVGRDGVEVRALVERCVARARAVGAAGARVEEARDAGLAGGARQLDARVVVDRVGDLRAQVAERVVGERGEVDDGVEAVELLGGDVADVGLARGISGSRRTRGWRTGWCRARAARGRLRRAAGSGRCRCSRRGR
jgi:hypothetical protein